MARLHRLSAMDRAEAGYGGGDDVDRLRGGPGLHRATDADGSEVPRGAALLADEGGSGGYEASRPQVWVCKSMVGLHRPV